MINFDSIQNEKALRTLIVKNLNKEIHGATKPSVDFIYKILEDAYNQGLKYDVSDMYDDILAFAIHSTNNADYCIKLVEKMHFKSDEPSDGVDNDDKPIVFYDVEVYPNLFFISWKRQGEKKKNHLFNPTQKDIEYLLKFRLIGFNCRRYDNHMLYARLLGYSNQDLFELSQKIITNKSKNNSCFFQEAYNISYTDVYDYAEKKQSLKKWEIELGIPHKELDIPWDKPVDKSLWNQVADYCDNDVDATEAVFDHTQEDFMCRLILVTMANILAPGIHSCPNDTTNQLSARIIFRGNKKPQSQFLYTDLATGKRSDGYQSPISFPGYKYEFGKSTYLDEILGEGGYVWAEPGMYANVKTFDVASMHPSSIEALNLFGDVYTQNFSDLKKFRINVKHSDWDTAKTAMNGALARFIDEIIEKDQGDKLASALKIVINSVYGLTSAKFDNVFRDPRNVDNIVAKRGALFMCQLKHELLEMGAKVIHIKTDSIKVVDPTPEIEEYILNKGKEYGYIFEVESIYDKICLVNDAVYIAKRNENDADLKKELKDNPNATVWSATGAQFAVPYVFKTCFSHEKLEFSDFCETKRVESCMYLDMNEGLLDDKYPIYSKLKEAREHQDGLISGKYTEDHNPLTKKEKAILEEYQMLTDDELDSIIAGYHGFVFIGKVGLFTPIKAGCGGGELLRQSIKRDGSIGYDSVVGTKGYRWLESDQVQKEHKENDIDFSYYNNLVYDAIETISKFGDYEWFVE